MRAIAFACLVFFAPAIPCAQAQEPSPPPAQSQSAEERFKALEERIRALEAELQALKAGHIVELIQMMKRDSVKLILVEPYFDLKTPNSVARETGAQVVVLLPSVGGEKEVADYFQLFDYDVRLLVRALQASR